MPLRDWIARAGRAARPALLAGAVFQLAGGLFLLSGTDGAVREATIAAHLMAGLSLAIALPLYLAWHVPRVAGSGRRALRLLGAAATTLTAAALGTGLTALGQAASGGSTGETLCLWHYRLGLCGVTLLLIHLAAAARFPAGRAAARGGLKGLAAAALPFGALVFIVTQATDLPLVSREPEHVLTPDTALAPRGGDGILISATGSQWPERPPPSLHCGASGCHEQIHHEWQESPHGSADRDPYFLALERRLVAAGEFDKAGACNECHDPVMLVTGRFAAWAREARARGTPRGAVPHSGEGVGCMACHSMKSAHGRLPRGNYAISPPRLGLAEQSGPGRMLLRADPGAHRRANGRTLYEKSRLCSGCHLATVEEEIPGFGMLRIENPYSRWELSHMKPLCQDCHMQKQKSSGGDYASHRFAGSGLSRSADPGQAQAVAAMLSGASPAPDIRGQPGSGPLLALAAGRARLTSSALAVELLLSDRGRIGHQFPAGAQDLLMVWIEAELTSSDGRSLARWGELREGGPLLPGTPCFSRGGFRRSASGATTARPVWALEGRPFGTLRPGESQAVTLERTPSPLRGQLEGLTLTARLCYRKLHAAAVAALGPGRDGRPLPLPPRSVLAELKTAIEFDGR